MKKAKRFAALVLALLSALSVVSCSTKETAVDEADVETEEVIAEDEETEEEAEPEPEETESDLAEEAQDIVSTERVKVKADKTPLREPTAEEAEKYPQVTNQATLYIQMDGNKSASQISHDEYMGATYTLVYGDTGIYEQHMEIKGRGNYSWSFQQKPFNLKLDEAANLLGMGSAKKWVLITTYSDKTLLRNYITLSLSCNLGMQYAPEVHYVDVYLNGKYNGLYVLSEKIELDNERIVADALFECEMQYRHDDCTYCISCPSGCHIMLKEPESSSYESIAEYRDLFNAYRRFFIKADTAMKKGIDEYSKYIDVDSFVDWYIVNELVKNYDSGFTTSCYCYYKDGKIYMGPCWDYDTCMGNQIVATCVEPTGYHVADSAWYGMLTEDAGFKEKLHARWTEIVDNGIIADFQSMIENLPTEIAESEKMDHDKWKAALKSSDLRGNMSLYTYDEEVEYLKNWVNKRIKWLNTQWYNN